MKSIAIILLLSLLPVTGFAQTDGGNTGEKTYVVGGGQNTPPRRKDTADAVYEDMTHEYVLKADGTVEYTYSHKLRLLTPYAFSRAYGESFITYNPEWQTLEVLRSVTTMRDGKKVESPFNAYNEVLPRYAAGSAPHLGLKEMVVTHVGVEAGAVIDYAYRITTKPGMFPGLMDRVVFGARSPINKITVLVKVPQGVPLEAAFARDENKPDKSEEDGMLVYRWMRRDVPIVEVEESQPPLDEFLPVLHFTTGSKEAMIRHCLQDVRDEDLGAAKAVVDDIMQKESDPVQRAMAMQRWVLARVGRMGGPLDILGYRARPPAATLRANTGSDLDRAVLLAAMCRAAGIDAVPVLFSTDIRNEGMVIKSTYHDDHRVDEFHPDGQPDLASLPLYQRAAVICKKIGTPAGLVLDPAHAQHSPVPEGFWGRFYLTLDEANPGPTQYSPPLLSPSVVSVTSDWILHEDLTVAGKSSVSMSGVRSYALEPDGMKGAVKSALASAGQGVKAEPGTPEVRASFETVCEADIASTKALAGTDGFVEFRLPVAPGGVASLHVPLGDVMRTTPIATPGSLKEEIRLTLHLPKNVQAVSVPKAVEFENAVGRIRSVIKADAHDVEVTRVIEITDGKLACDSYPYLTKLLRAWFDPQHTTLLLKVQ